MIYQPILVVSDSFIKGVIYLNAQGFFSLKHGTYLYLLPAYFSDMLILNI